MPGARLEHSESDAPSHVSSAMDQWGHVSLTDLVDQTIATHHEHLCLEMPRLGVQMDQAIAEQGRRYPWLRPLGLLFDEYTRLSRSHMSSTEQIAFPLIRELRCAAGRPGCYPGGLESCAAELAGYHRAAKELLARMRQLTNGFAVPCDAGPALMVLLPGLKALNFDQELHAAKELHGLLPRALEAEQRLCHAPHIAVKAPRRAGDPES